MNDRRRRLAGDMNFQMAAHRAALPHHEEPERVMDAWEAGGLRYQLVERGGLFRLEVWHLYRWEVCEKGGVQVIARRIADLHPGNVVQMRRPA